MPLRGINFSSHVALGIVFMEERQGFAPSGHKLLIPCGFGDCFYGGETGIRTLGPLQDYSFQDYRFRPLSHLSLLFGSSNRLKLRQYRKDGRKKQLFLNDERCGTFVLNINKLKHENFKIVPGAWSLFRHESADFCEL